MTTIVALDLETTGLDPDRHHIWEIGAVVRDHRDPRYNGRWQIMLRPNLAAAEPAALRIGRYYERATPYVGDRDQPPSKVLGSDTGPVTWVVEAPPGKAGMGGWGPVTELGGVPRRAVARWLAQILDGATIVGANPAFDAGFMARFLRAHGHAPTWHHHLVDVAALTAGYLAGTRDGYNTSVEWLADAHNGSPQCGTCQVPPPDLDTVEIPTPAWRTGDLADRLGVTCAPELRHTALGDAAWALAIYDQVMTGKDSVGGGDRG
ncbi:hypothetical protein [Micromonospora sp. NPDC050200]|uniref:3'-5' exonuclease n=1 Tax=Micromonospora sp. NPDC050200 TaxID=3155664 RepID=UPI0033EBB70C